MLKEKWMKEKSLTISLSDQNFDDQVLKSGLLYLVNFRGEWSGSCHIMEPVIAEMSVSFKGEMLVGRLDIDNEKIIAARFGIHSVPHILFFLNGVVVKEIIGIISKCDLSMEITALLNK